MLSQGVIHFVFIQFFIHMTFGQVCYPKADTVFLLDGSDSILKSEFRDQKDVILQYSQSISLLSNDVRVGAQVYSSINDVAGGIDLMSSSQISPALLEILMQPSHGSRLDYEMARLKAKLAVTGRQNEAQIAVVFSDGRVENLAATLTSAEDMKASGIYIITVGVGRNIMKADLQSISSLPLDYRTIRPIKDVVDNIINVTTTIGTKWCSRTILPVFTTVAPPSPKQTENGQLLIDFKTKGNAQDTMIQNQNETQNIRLETQFQDIPPMMLTTIDPLIKSNQQQTTVQSSTPVPPQQTDLSNQQGIGKDKLVPTQQTIPIQTPIGQHPTNPSSQGANADMSVQQGINTDILIPLIQSVVKDTRMQSHQNLPIQPGPDFTTNDPMQPEQFANTDMPISTGQGAHTDIPLLPQHGTNTDLPIINNQGFPTDMSTTTDQGLHTKMSMSQQQNFNTDLPVSTQHGFNTDLPFTTPHGFSTDLPVSTQQGFNTDLPFSTQQGFNTDLPVSTQQGFNIDLPVSTHQDFNTDLPVSSQQGFNIDLPVSTHQDFNTDLPVSTQQGFNAELPVSTQQGFNTDLPVSTQQGLNTDLPVSTQQGFNRDIPSPQHGFNKDLPMSSQHGIHTNLPIQLTQQGFTTDKPVTPKHGLNTDMPISTNQGGNKETLKKQTQSGIHTNMAMHTQKGNPTDIPMVPKQSAQTDIPIATQQSPSAGSTDTNTGPFENALPTEQKSSQVGPPDRSATQQLDPAATDSTNIPYINDLNQTFQQIDDFSSSVQSTNTLTSGITGSSKTNMNSGNALDTNTGVNIDNQQNREYTNIQNRLVVQPNNEAEVRLLLQVPTNKDKTLTDIFEGGKDQQNANSQIQEQTTQNQVDQLPPNIQLQTGSSGKTIYELVQSLIRMQKQLQRTIDETPEVANNVVMPSIYFDQNSGIGKLLKASSAFSSVFEKHLGPAATQDVHPAYEIVGSPPVSPKAQPPFNLPDISTLDNLLTNTQTADKNMNLQQQSEVPNQQSPQQQDTNKQTEVLHQLNTEAIVQQTNNVNVKTDKGNEIIQSVTNQQGSIDPSLHDKGHPKDMNTVPTQNNNTALTDGDNQHKQQPENVKPATEKDGTQEQLPTKVMEPALQVIPGLTFSNDQQLAVPGMPTGGGSNQAGIISQIANVQKMLKYIPSETASQITTALQNLGITQDKMSSGSIDLSTLDTTLLAGTLKQLNNVLAGQTSISQLNTVDPATNTDLSTASAATLTETTQQQPGSNDTPTNKTSQIAGTIQTTDLTTNETIKGITNTGTGNTQPDVGINLETASQIATALKTLDSLPDQTGGTEITADTASQIAGTLKELNNVLAVAGQTTLGSDQQTMSLDPVSTQAGSTKLEISTPTLGTQATSETLKNPIDLNKKESINNLINVLQKTSDIITEEIRKTEEQGGAKDTTIVGSQIQKPVQTTAAPVNPSPSVVTNIKKVINYRITSPPPTTPHMYIHPTDIPLEPITNPVLTINTLQDPNQPFVDIKNLPDGKQDMVQSFIEKKPKSPKLSPMQQALIDSFVKVNSQHQSEEQARHTLEVLTNAIAQAQRQRLISQPQGTNIQQTDVFNTIFNSKEGGISSQSAVNTLQIIADALALLSKSGNFPQIHGGQPGHAPNVVQINQQNQLTTNASALTTAMLVVTSNRSETHQTQPTGPTTSTDVISGVSTQQNNFGLQVDPKVTSKQIQTSEPRVVTTVTETKTQQPSQPTTKSLPITSPMSQPTQQPVVTVPVTQSPPPPNPVDFVWGQSLSQLTPETGQKPYQISPPVDNINAADPYVQFAGSLSQSPSNQNSFETWQGKESTFQFQTDPTLFPSVFQTQFPPYQFGDNTQLPHDQTPGQHPGVIVQSVAGESQPFPQPFANNQQPMPPENNQLPNINTVKNLNSMGNLQQNQFFNQNQDTGIAIHTQNQPPQAEYKSGLANFLNGQGSESNTNLFNNVPGLQQHIPPAVPLVNDVQVPKDVSVQPTPPIRIDSLPAVVDGAPAIQNNAVPLQDLNPTTPPINNDQQLPTPVALDTTTPMQVPLVGDGTENNLLANGQTPEIKSKTEKDNQTIGSGQITNQEQNFLNQQQTDTGKVRGVELVPEQPVNLVTDITVQQAHSLQNNQQDIEKQQMLQESNLQPETTQQQNMSLQTSQINEIIQTNLEGNQPKPVQIIETRIQQPGQGIQHQNTSVEQAGQSQENIQPPSNEINAQATIDVISVKTNKTDQVPQNISKPVTEPNKPKFHSTFLMSPEELSRISQQQNQASLSANTRTSIAAEANNIFQNGGLFGQIDDLVGGKTSNNEILKQPSESIPVTSSKVDVQNVATDNSGATTTVQPQNKGAEPGGLSLNELLWGPNYRRLMDNYATLEKQRAAEATEAARQLQEQRRLEQEKLKQQTTEPLQTNRVPVTDMTGEKTDQSNSFDLGNIIGPTFQTIKTKTVQPVQIRTTQTRSRPLSSLKLFDINYPLHVPVIVNGQLVTSKATNRHSGMSSTRSQTTSTRSLDESRIATRTVVVPSTTTGSIKQGQSIVNVTKPVQTQAQRELYDLCLGSQFVNGIAYNAIPSSCHEFVQCFYYEGAIQVEKGRCPFRMHWDQDLLLCRPARFGFCQRDPCLRNGVSTYSAGDCRSYYECNNGQPRPMCCPFGMRHEPGVGKCVVDTSCISWCKETGDEYFEKAFPNCRMMPFYTNAGFYFDEIPGVGMMPRMCAGGSTFNPALCVCETPDKIDFDANNQAAMISKCKPEFSLDFTDEFRDLSGNNLPLNHEHVHIDRQAAKFEGDGKITIWRFSGGSFGDEVAFTLRFKPIVNWFGSQRMDLLSNCDREGPSVGISVTASNIGGYVSFMANASESGVTSFDIAYKGDGWNNVTYIYDGKHLTGSVNGVSNTIPLMGTIDQRRNPLSLGSCNYVNNYVGLMDDVRIYLCVPRWLL